MKPTSHLRRFASIGAILATAFAFSTMAQAAGPEIVAGPGADPDCFKPGSADTKSLSGEIMPDCIIFGA